MWKIWMDDKLNDTDEIKRSCSFLIARLYALALSTLIGTVSTTWQQIILILKPVSLRLDKSLSTISHVCWIFQNIWDYLCSSSRSPELFQRHRYEKNASVALLVVALSDKYGACQHLILLALNLWDLLLYLEHSSSGAKAWLNYNSICIDLWPPLQD